MEELLLAFKLERILKKLRKDVKGDWRLPIEANMGLIEHPFTAT